MAAQDIIQQALLEARRSWEAHMETRLKEIYDLFQMSSNNIINQMERYSIKGTIPPYRLNLLYDSIKKEMQILRIALNGRFNSFLNDSINGGIGDQIKTLDQLTKDGLFSGKFNLGSSQINVDGSISKYSRDLSTYSKSMWGKINKDAMEFLLRYPFSGDMLSSRIWHVTYEAGRAIRQAIQMGVLEGWSSDRLAGSIKDFLQEKNRLYRRVRKDGRLVLSKAARGYHPGQGMYRSSYKNAMRLARTEINRAYTEGALRYGATKPWIDGYIWRVGSGNPCPICAGNNGNYYSKDDVGGIPAHPHCMCWWEMRVAKEKLIDQAA